MGCLSEAPSIRRPAGVTARAFGFVAAVDVVVEALSPPHPAAPTAIAIAMPIPAPARKVTCPTRLPRLAGCKFGCISSSFSQEEDSPSSALAHETSYEGSVTLRIGR